MGEPLSFNELLHRGCGAFRETTEPQGSSLSFRTGSRVYGPASANSDIDFAVLIPFHFNLLADLVVRGVKLTESNYFKAVKFECMGYSINLIPLSACDFVAWHKATEAMTLTTPIADKNLRCIVFQQLVQAYKTANHGGIGEITKEYAADYIVGKNEPTLKDLPLLIPPTEMPF